MKWYNLSNVWSGTVNLGLLESNGVLLCYNKDEFGWLTVTIDCPDSEIAEQMNKQLGELWHSYKNSFCATANTRENFVKILHQGMKIIMLDKNGQLKKYKILPHYLPAGPCLIHDAIIEGIDPLMIE